MVQHELFRSSVFQSKKNIFLPHQAKAAFYFNFGISKSHQTKFVSLILGRRLHGSSGGCRLTKTGTDKGWEARPQLHDGHSANKAGELHVPFSINLLSPLDEICDKNVNERRDWIYLFSFGFSWKMQQQMCYVKRGWFTKIQGLWNALMPVVCALIKGNSFWPFMRKFCTSFH